MARIRTDNVFGTTTNDPLLVGGTTLNSAGLANLAAVAGTDVAVITLDPNRVNGAPEIVHVTAHTGAATSATILRGQEGTVAREHPAGTFWVHAWTALDAGLGEVAYVQQSAGQTGISTTEVDLTSLAATFTHPAGRRLKATLSVAWQLSSTANNSVRQVITDGVPTLLERKDVLLRSAAGAVGGEVILRTTSTGASQTLKGRARTETAANTASTISVAGVRSFFLVEDIGPA